MPITTILFDVHRTLVDDSGFPKQFIWNFMRAAGKSVEFPDYERRYRELVQHFFDWPSIQPFILIREIHRRRLRRLYQEFELERDIETDLNFLWEQMAGSRIYPEVPSVLPVMQQKFRCALVSNADNDDPLIQILKDQGYQFHTVVTSEMVQSYKPNPEIFLRALADLNCPPDEALVVGDSPLADILGARNAGIKMVWVNRTNQVLPPDYPPPDFKIQNLTGLIPLLNQLT